MALERINLLLLRQNTFLIIVIGLPLMLKKLIFNNLFIKPFNTVKR